MIFSSFLFFFSVSLSNIQRVHWLCQYCMYDLLMDWRLVVHKGWVDTTVDLIIYYTHSIPLIHNAIIVLIITTVINNINHKRQ